jgi:hypothetical protein
MDACFGRKGREKLTANELNGHSAGLCGRDDLVDACMFTQVVGEKSVSCGCQSQKGIEVGKLTAFSTECTYEARHVRQIDR